MANALRMMTKEQGIAEVSRLTSLGNSQYDIAAKLSTTQSAVSMFMRKHGISARNTGCRGLTEDVVAKRIAYIRGLEAQGKGLAQMASGLGITAAAVSQFRQKYMGSKPVERNYGSPKAYAEQSRWQVADPAGFDQELVDRAVKVLRCTPHRAAWLLSCPRATHPQHRCRVGWNGGSAIG